MIEYIIYAILQGLLEWLPISSDGQTMDAAIKTLGIPPNEVFSLSIWLHLGILIAVLVKFREEFVKMGKSFFPHKFKVVEVDIKKRNWLISSTIGTLITAIPLYYIFKIVMKGSFTANQGDFITLIISGLLILIGIFFLTSKKIFGEITVENTNTINILPDSFLAGLTQGIAILPGISISGLTVSTIILEKYNHNEALRMSFLMTVPAEVVFICINIGVGKGSILVILDPIVIITIMMVSFMAAYASIELLLRVAKKIRFGYFCIFYGAISFALIVPFYFL